MTDKLTPEFSLGPAWGVAKVIGAIAAAWAMLELHIDLVVWSLAEVKPLKGACITAQLPNVSRRLYALASLVDQHNPSEALRKKIAQYIEASNKLSRKRNRVIHDPWLHKGDINSPLSESYRVELTAEMKLTFRYKSVSFNDLINLAIEIEAHREALMNLCKEIDAELGTSSANFANLIGHGPKDSNDHG